MHSDLFLIAIRLKKACNKAVGTYSSAAQFVLECCKSDETVDSCSFVFFSAPDQYMTQEMCDKKLSRQNIAVIHTKPKTFVIKLLILIC